MKTQFRMDTIMVFGALIQAVISAILPLRYAFVPAGFLIASKIFTMYAMKTGLMKNTYMDGVIMSKYSAQFPDKSGDFGNQPARDSMCVFLIGARNNSPIGLLHKGNKKLGEYMNAMQEELKADPEKHGLLGTSAWTGTEREASPAVMLVMYFKSAADVHRYAHGELHRKGWTWWYNNIKDLGEISIFHELYEVPSGNYETIYDHMPPMLAAATQHKLNIKTDQGVQAAYMNPSVDARKGLLKSSRGRMSRSNGADNDRYGHDDEGVYEDVRDQEIA